MTTSQLHQSRGHAAYVRSKRLPYDGAINMIASDPVNVVKITFAKGAPRWTTLQAR